MWSGVEYWHQKLSRLLLWCFRRKKTDFSAPNLAYVGCGALQPHFAIWEMMLMQEKQYDMPQNFVLSTDPLS